MIKMIITTATQISHNTTNVIQDQIEFKGVCKTNMRIKIKIETE